MKCPYCEYEDGWSSDKMENVEGEEGKFFVLSNDVVAIRSDRPTYYISSETKEVHFCPKCGKGFIEV